jgi:hypothetical protein
MNYHLLVTLLIALARALLAHGCGEALRLFLHCLAPGIPPLICVAIGLALGVMLIEVAAMLWRRRAAAHDVPESRPMPNSASLSGSKNSGPTTS